ncbi:MAG: hypothetical protein R3B89_24845 [Polyangiaceae bacterium]
MRGTLVALGLMVGCSPAPSEPRVVVPIRAPSPAPTTEPNVAVELPHAHWTEFPSHELWLPISEAEFDELRFENRYTATLDGRVVWLNLDYPEARGLLGAIDGPLGVTLNDPSVELLVALNQVAARVPVAVRLRISTPDAAKRVEHLSEVQLLDANLRATTETLPDSSKLEGLRYLKLVTDAPNANSVLRGLTPRLITLDLQARLTAEVVPDLERLTHLESLKVGFLHEYLPLAHLTRLKALNTPLTDESLRELAEFPHLTELTVRGCRFTKGVAQSFARLRKLRQLTFKACSVNEAAIEEISKLPELEGFSYFDELSPAEFSALHRAKQLVRLALGPHEFGGAELSGFAEFPRLKEVSLILAGLDDDAAEVLSRMTQLERLVISKTFVSPVGLKKLGRLSQLRVLDASDNLEVDDSVIREWASKLSELRQLEVGGTQVTAQSVKPLSTLPHLRWLGLTHYAVDRTTLEYLASAPSLVYLNVVAPPVPCDVVRQRLEFPVYCRDISEFQ